jgi:lipoprotein-anchoring transpeptidase ErfK/SrfK
MSHLFKVVLVGILGLLFSCNESNNKTTTAEERPVPKRKYEQSQAFTYTVWSLKNDSIRKVFKSKFTSSELTTIVSLNRIDKANLKQADTIIVPDKFDEDFLAYSPFPFSVENSSEIPKLVVFSYPIQAYGVYEFGKLVKWGPTSLGSKKYPTPTGLFFTNWKGEEVQSTVDDEWILRWNFNIENTEGIGWHQYELPGYPASHSCLRLLEADAKWLYDWADEWVLKGANTVLAKGTPVIVFGTYDFNAPSPWLALANNPNANEISKSDLESIIAPHLSQIKKEQENRKKVENVTVMKVSK